MPNNTTPSLPQAVLTAAALDNIVRTVQMHERGYAFEGDAAFPAGRHEIQHAIESAILSRMGGESVPAWQPIETAPDTADEILVRTETGKADIVTGKYVQHHLRAAAVDGEPCYFSLWMPIPAIAAPTAPAQQAAPEEPALFHLRGHGDVTEEQLIAFTTPAGQQAADVQGEPPKGWQSAVKLARMYQAEGGTFTEEGSRILADAVLAMAAVQSVPKGGAEITALVDAFGHAMKNYGVALQGKPGSTEGERREMLGARDALLRALAASATTVGGVDLSQWKNARFGYFDAAGAFVELPGDDAPWPPEALNPRWVGGSHAMQLLRAALATAAPEELSCGHHASLMLRSAETGEPLYCELCDERSARKDAERRETELMAANDSLRAQLAKKASTPVRSKSIDLGIIRKWPDGVQDRLYAVWNDVIGFIPNVKLYDLQRVLGEFGFTMVVYEGTSLATQEPSAAEPSPTQGMNLSQRIAHVGGRENAAGYVEFGSPMAVKALIDHVLRDLPMAVGAAAEPVDRYAYEIGVEEHELRERIDALTGATRIGRAARAGGEQ